MVNKYIGKQNTPYMDPMGKDATQKKGLSLFLFGRC